MIQVYNVGMIALNFYIAVELIACLAAVEPRRLICLEVDYSFDPQAIRAAKALWWFYISKAVEFFDTFSMVLRKKTAQLSFLHVYHRKEQTFDLTY